MLSSIPVRMVLIAALVMLSACATTDEEEESNLGASELYKEAKEALEAGDYETAVQRYESLEARYPFGQYAQQAQLDIAYAYFKFDEPESAIAAADRFIKLYPRHPRVDYAYYLRGIIKFAQGKGAFDGLESQDPAKRDPGAAEKAFRYFSEVVQRFPDSEYAEDAALRMIYLRNNLARHHLLVAQFYMKREAYVAVVNRAKHIVETFHESPSVVPALELMADAYEHLGLHDLAKDARRVYEKNKDKNKEG
ncbi:MAG: outer membrane protein assembly factor BamD [Gammaproteobacteria bacterium]|nr:outer membrane protein assembly factor BamD [Gammaproteobacteria bacterium]